MISLIFLIVLSFTWQLVLVGSISFLLWYFVFRRYRSLGLRLFYIFGLIALMMTCWFYNDKQEATVMEKEGHLLSARIINKATEKSQGNALTLAFELKKDSSQVVSTSAFISDEEFAALHIGQNIDILYNPEKNMAYYLVSYNRYKKDRWIFYVLPAFFLTLGIISGLLFRKYQVGIHEETGDEYLEKDGKMIYDEQNSKAAQMAKRVNILSKLFQVFK